MKDFIPADFEKKWQEVWEEKGIYQCETHSDKPNYYALVMFPYPSGTLHVGHVKNYVIGDIVARYKRLQGYNVLHPMGFDSFGLPAENAAIAKGIPPETSTYTNIDIIKEQLGKLSISYDWSRQLETSNINYYKWTQYLFLRMYEKGLAYKKEAAVNWCPGCNTVLANEQVVNGKCERCDSDVEIKQLEQWFFKITDYAERLLQDLEKLDEWPERVKTMQKNWIGKSKGAQVTFKIDGTEDSIDVYTTRPDTLWGVTFMAVAPESPLLEQLTTDDKKEEVRKFQEAVAKEDRFLRTSEDYEKEGVFLGTYAINPVNGEKIPIYVANYILMEYGTGAIMAVPAHDQRDFEFAEKYDIPITVVIDSEGETLIGKKLEKASTEPGIMVNSGPFSGMKSQESLKKVIEWVEEKGIGKGTTQYKLRDWLISRQRYWGAPIPMVYCEKCGVVPVPYEDLPVELPLDVQFDPTGKSPLTKDDRFLHTTCPKCGGEARREMDTMDTFVDSSWYYLRYINPHLEDKPFNTEDVNQWLPVNQYIGGVEHAILHLLYSRFITKVLYDLGEIDFEEPFKNLFTQGMIYKDGFKMSKSKGNVVSPEKMIEDYGADTLRMYTLFMGPPEKDTEWNDSGIEGVYKFVKKVWKAIMTVIPEISKDKQNKTLGKEEKALRRKLHQMIKKITKDIEEDFHFNTAISGMMEVANELYAYITSVNPEDWHTEVVREVSEKLLILMAPFAPHMTEELWHEMGHDTLVVLEKWPEVDESALVVDEVEIVVQINGKIRDKFTVSAGLSKEETQGIAFDRERVKELTDGKNIKKIIVVPNKIVNIVAV
ncbi:MAG TPA: leucine--tRNA ligase [Thermotogota bacterium]|nr:leucine--tRNA ligase [Thermotogota bacterium]